MASFCRNNIWKTAALCACCFFLFACENDIKDIKALTDKRISVEEGIDIVSYLSQQAKVKAKLTAPLMKRYQTDSPYVEFPKSLHVDFYDDSLKIESQLNARYGRFRENEHKVLLRDSVVLFNTKGDTLHCRELWWDQLKEKFYTDKPVRIYQPGNILFGDGLEASQDFSERTIINARGSVTVPRDSIPQ